MISEVQPGDAAPAVPTLTPRQREAAARAMRDAFYEITNGSDDEWRKLKEIYERRFDQFVAKLDLASLQIVERKS